MLDTINLLNLIDELRLGQVGRGRYEEPWRSPLGLGVLTLCNIQSDRVTNQCTNDMSMSSCDLDGGAMGIVY